MKVAVMGCIVNGPGESKHADIGISLPGTGEAPAAPVFIDGEKALTLRGDNIAAEFHALVENYIEKRFGYAPRAMTPSLTKPTRRCAESIAARVKGMNDILPRQRASARHERHPAARLGALGVVRGQGARADGALRLPVNVRTPIVEPTALFVRGLGEVTDIVEKEMYSFDGRDERRPADAAPRGHRRHRARDDRAQRALQRAAAPVDHRRRCSATSGRRRAATASSTRSTSRRWASPGPDVDAELILMCRALLARPRPGRRQRRAARAQQPGPAGRAQRAPRRADRATSRQHADALDEDARRRLHSNPLRILDTKNPAMQAMVEARAEADGLPRRRRRSRTSTRVRAVLDAAGLAYRINPRLVRGLDYYNLTVFEWITDQLGSQGTVCGGGRYDGLFEQLGGKPTPAVGWGMGIERMLLLLEAVGVADARRGARRLRDRARRRRAAAGA